MNTLKKINSALLTAYQSIFDPDLPTAYEARDFAPPAGQPWARVLNVPAEKYVNTLGDGGEDNVTGFFQIDYYVPENDGTARLHGYADSTLVVFKNGARFTYQGQEVKIRRTSFSPIRRDDKSASFNITLSIYWDSSTLR